MTTTRTRREITQTPGEKSRVGKNNMPVTAFTITCEEFTWSLYRAANDSWWEGCGNCDADSGFKSVYAGIYGGVCFQCGGAGVRRMAGSEEGMLRRIRERATARSSRANAVQRAAERDLARLDDWNVQNQNLASDLARVRTSDDFSGNVLAQLALSAHRAPLSPRQVAYALSLLIERAWGEAHAIEYPKPERVWLGSVGDKVTVEGVLNVVHLLRADRFDRQDQMLLVLEHTNADGEVAHLKMRTAATWAFGVARGERVTVTGAVKDHEESEGFGKQTVLVRPKRQS
jgi:hypothetical protein